MAYVSTEFATQEYELLRVELRSLHWRTNVMLLGSTFLVFFWFSAFGEMVLKTSGPTVLRSFVSLPLVTCACTWMVWLLSDLASQLLGRREEFRERTGPPDSDYDLRLLDRIEVLRVRVARANRYNRFLNTLIASEFVLIGVMTGFIFLSVK